MNMARHKSLVDEKSRAWARIELVRAQENGARGLRLTCEDKHTWTSDIDPRSEDRAGVRTPRCPRFKKFYATRDILIYRHDASKKCDHKCRRATKPVCVCSCDMLNHGIEAVRTAPA